MFDYGSEQDESDEDAILVGAEQVDKDGEPIVNDLLTYFIRYFTVDSAPCTYSTLIWH